MVLFAFLFFLFRVVKVSNFNNVANFNNVDIALPFVGWPFVGSASCTPRTAQWQLGDKEDVRSHFSKLRGISILWHQHPGGALSGTVWGQVLLPPCMHDQVSASMFTIMDGFH